MKHVRALEIKDPAHIPAILALSQTQRLQRASTPVLQIELLRLAFYLFLLRFKFREPILYYGEDRGLAQQCKHLPKKHELDPWYQRGEKLY